MLFFRHFMFFFMSTLVLLALVCNSADAQIPRIALQARQVLEKHCYKCHGKDGVATAGLNVLKWEQLTGTGGFVTGKKPDDSLLYEYLASGSMPPEDDERVTQRPTETETAVIKEWIKAGAPSFQEKIIRPFISPEEVLVRIRTDLEALDGPAHTIRYFTLTHLYNAGLRQDELITFRIGLSKLINSLSWHDTISVPQPIDDEYTIYRIDLRDYQWDERSNSSHVDVWDAIVLQNPYNIQSNSDASRYITKQTGHPMSYVRADWFVAAASRPPLYHDILEIPQSDIDLEERLGIDVADNIDKEKIARAGFTSSGVSNNNRLIERHVTKYGSYWKSYDFAGNKGRQLLTEFPLGPGDEKEFFKHDGGEIIFNLPNGLQAYMLVDADGQRIDKGPTTVVQDPNNIAREGGAVVNGISCMNCHQQGMIRKNDEIRPYALKNPIVFEDRPQALESIRNTYLTHDVLQAFYDQDASRHMQAAYKAGSPAITNPQTEKPQLVDGKPIIRLSTQFQNELDLNLAAAETGVSTVDFLVALEQHKKLARQLGLLRIPGKKIKRDTFVAALPTLIEVLELGRYRPLEQDLVAFYPFNGNAKDESGNGNHATVIGALTAVDRFGNSSGAYRFNGKNTHIRYERALTTLQPFTWSVWFRSVNPVAINNQFIISQADGPGGGGVSPHLQIIDGVLIFGSYETDSGGHEVVASKNAPLKAGAWYHAVITSTADGERRLYVNGELDDFANGQPFGPVLANTYFGVRGGLNLNEDVFNGQLDDIRIYKRALSETEVKALYDAEKSGTLEGLPLDASRLATLVKSVLTITAPSDGIHDVNFSPNGRFLVNGNKNGTVTIWDAENGKQVTTLKAHSDNVWSVCFSPDGSRLATASGMGRNNIRRTLYGSVKIWDTLTNEVVHSLDGHSSTVLKVTFSPDGKQLASSSADDTIQLWDVDTGKRLRIFKGHTDSVWNVAFSPDGQTLASSGMDETVRLWNVNTGLEIRTLKGHSYRVLGIAFSPDGKRLASASGSQAAGQTTSNAGVVKVWDVATGRELLSLEGHTKAVRCVTFSPDGTLIASGSWGDTVKLWNATTGVHLLDLTGHTGAINSLAFRPDGKQLASGSADNTIRVWSHSANAGPRQVAQRPPKPDVKAPSKGININGRWRNVHTGNILRFEQTGNTVRVTLVRSKNLIQLSGVLIRDGDKLNSTSWKAVYVADKEKDLRSGSFSAIVRSRTTIQANIPILFFDEKGRLERSSNGQTFYKRFGD
jgi:WD40 repeat protein